MVAGRGGGRADEHNFESALALSSRSTFIPPDWNKLEPGAMRGARSTLFPLGGRFAGREVRYTRAQAADRV